MQNLSYLIGVVMVFKILKNYQIPFDINLDKLVKSPLTLSFRPARPVPYRSGRSRMSGRDGGQVEPLHFD